MHVTPLNFTGHKNKKIIKKYTSAVQWSESENVIIKSPELCGEHRLVAAAPGRAHYDPGGGGPQLPAVREVREGSYW